MNLTKRIVLRLVRANQPLLIIFLLAYTFLLRSYQLMYPIQWKASDSNLLSNFLYEYISYNSFGASIFAMILVFIQGLMVNGIVKRYKMTKNSGYVPAMLYILFASFIPEFLYLSPVLLANTFGIIAIFQMFRWYRNYEAASEIFNVGFWLAIGSMFDFSLSAFYFLALVGLSNLRSFKSNEIVILTIGFIVPYFLVGVGQFWFDQFDSFWNELVLANFSFFDVVIENTALTYLKLIVYVVVVLWIFLQSQQYYFKTSIQVQKNINVLLFSIFISLLSIIYVTSYSLENLIYLAFPIAFFTALNLLNAKKTAVAEVIHLLLIATLFSFQYKEYIIDVFTK